MKYRHPLKVINWILSAVCIMLLTLMSAVSVFALWNNDRVFKEAQDILVSMEEYKPDEDNGYSLDEIRKINPDVCGWITIEGTAIDYPILQGKDNTSYLNTDVYGRFALAGSIFLDSRNDNTFRDAASVIYGHHMAEHLMFGDLDMFAEEGFFLENQSASITTLEDTIELSLLAVLEIPDSSHEIFEPTMWGYDLSELADYIAEHALHIDQSWLDHMRRYPTSVQVISLATCISHSTTGNRTVVIYIVDRPESQTPYDPDQTWTEVNTGDDTRWGLYATISWSVFSFLLAVLSIRRFMTHATNKR